jgi:hypothetical protein
MFYVPYGGEVAESSTSGERGTAALPPSTRAIMIIDTSAVPVYGKTPATQIV